MCLWVSQNVQRNFKLALESKHTYCKIRLLYYTYMMYLLTMLAVCRIELRVVGFGSIIVDLTAICECDCNAFEVCVCVCVCVC